MSLRSMIVAIAIAAGVMGCDDDASPPIEVTPGEVSVPVGLATEVAITEAGQPAAAAGITWQVDDPAIAAVTWEDDRVSVLGRAVGRTRAVAAYAGTELVVDVEVTPAIVQGLEVSAGAVRVPIGVEQPVAATARMSDGARVDVTTQVEWTFEDPTIADIAGDSVRGLGLGSTIAHAAYAGFTASFGVQVVEAVLVGIAVSPPDPQVVTGIGVDFTAEGLYSDGTVVDLTTQVVWSLGDPAVAALAGRRATGVAPGTTVVTASHEGVTGMANLTVSSVVPVELRVTPDRSLVPAGFSQTFRAVAILSDGEELDVTDEVVWTSSAPLVAAVQSGSTVHGWMPGTTSVTAQFGALEAAARLDVAEAVLVSIEITPGAVSLAAGTSRPLVATGYFSDGRTQDVTADATWWTGDSSTVGVSAGVITAIAPGAGSVHAWVGGSAGSADVTVTSAEVESVEVATEESTLIVGATSQLHAVAHFTDGQTRDVTAETVWSSDSSAVYVDSLQVPGSVTALNSGTATITAQIGACAAYITIDVAAARIVQPPSRTTPAAFSSQ